MNELHPPIIQSEYQDAIQALQALTRDHAKAFRLGVGSYILQRFFGGSAAMFSSRDPTKDASFAGFTATHAEDLAQLDLSEQTLRRCVRVRICYDTLPPAVRDQLAWSATLHISTLAEPHQRARLAVAAVAESWSVARVKEAVERASHHRLWDADPSAPGLQLPPPAPAPAIQPGRLVTRTEKWTQEIDSWHQEFDRIDAKKLSKTEVKRIRDAVATVRQQLDTLEKKLG